MFSHINSFFFLFLSWNLRWESWLCWVKYTLKFIFLVSRVEGDVIWCHKQRRQVKGSLHTFTKIHISTCTSSVTKANVFWFYLLKFQNKHPWNFSLQWNKTDGNRFRFVLLIVTMKSISKSLAKQLVLICKVKCSPLIIMSETIRI